MTGLKAAMVSLKDAGCKTVYVDGSFVTGKERPGDFDACWEEEGVDPIVLDPVLLTSITEGLARKPNTWGSCFRRLQSQMKTGSRSLNSSKRTKKREGGRVS